MKAKAVTGGPVGMDELNRKAFGGLLNLLVCVALMLFLPAWTIRWWQAWVFLAVFFIPSLLITFYLMKRDPKLLERRVSAGVIAEKTMFQKVVQGMATLAFVALLVFPAIDHRLGLSRAPIWADLAGDVLVVLGFLVVFLVFRENTFTSGIIEVAEDQKVISTGPYGIVRHPMYVGALVLLLGTPLALGSVWGLLVFIPMAVAIAVRLLDEETFLGRNLEGYVEYRKKVRYRLVPFVW